MSIGMIGMDPHKRSATIEVMAPDETVVVVAGTALTLPGTRRCRVTGDAGLEVLRVLAGRRRALGEDHTRMICQLRQLLADLIPGGSRRRCPRPRPGPCWPRRVS
jgi:hypothetical protein